MDMDRYVRKQAIMSGLSLNLNELYEERDRLSAQLIMIDKMIDKHESYLTILEEEDE